jgi:hypothetical protein
VLIFDKSVLESLNPDEAMWLDNFFLCNLTPLFFIEVLGDLEKQVRAGRTPEQVVGSLAYRTPDASCRPNVHHMTLLAAELTGADEVDMRYGRPIITGGRVTELEGKTGIFFHQSPEEEAFQRWQRHEFLEVERSLARRWRRALSNINLEEHYRFFQRFFPIGKPRSLGDVKRLMDFHLNDSDQETVFRFGMSLLGISQEATDLVMRRWTTAGKPAIKTFAPYFLHVFSVDFFFYLVLAADLIGRDRPSHKIDLAYLYYLPFCMVFTSNDKLHIDLTPFFLREDQSFVRGVDLKSDLGRLDQHYVGLPEETKNEGVMGFAFYPPADDSFLVARLWDKYMARTWRENAAKPRRRPTREESDKIIADMRRFEEDSKPVSSAAVSSDQAHRMVIERKVYAEKGKWKRFPPDVMERMKNEQGQWQDSE